MANIHEDGLPSAYAEEVLDLVARVPPGRVVTYGDLAALVGRGGPRSVGAVMAHFGGDVPWWRVVRAGGLPPRCHEEEALARWRAERTPLAPARAPGRLGGRVDLDRARWVPG